MTVLVSKQLLPLAPPSQMPTSLGAQPSRATLVCSMILQLKS